MRCIIRNTTVHKCTSKCLVPTHPSNNTYHTSLYSTLSSALLVSSPTPSSTSLPLFPHRPSMVFPLSFTVLSQVECQLGDDTRLIIPIFRNGARPACCPQFQHRSSATSQTSHTCAPAHTRLLSVGAGLIHFQLSYWCARQPGPSDVPPSGAPSVLWVSGGLTGTAGCGGPCTRAPCPHP